MAEAGHSVPVCRRAVPAAVLQHQSLNSDVSAVHWVFSLGELAAYAGVMLLTLLERVIAWWKRVYLVASVLL